MENFTKPRRVLTITTSSHIRKKEKLRRYLADADSRIDELTKQLQEQIDANVYMGKLLHEQEVENNTLRVENEQLYDLVKFA